MANVIALATRPRRETGAAGRAALVSCFARHRRAPDDVFWLKENAELLSVLRATGQGRAEDLAAYGPVLADLPARLSFFPQYYRFLLSIALDLEDMGLGQGRAEIMADRVVRDGLSRAELSDLQRAEARRLLARRGLSPAQDAGLDDRLRDFARRSESFALPNRKAAYELTHILFYLSDYGAREPALGPEVERSLHYAGLVALLEHNSDLLAEICIALRFSGSMPPAGWEAWVKGRLQATRLTTGAQAQLPDSYHEWMMAEWMQGVSGGPVFAGRFSDQCTSFHMAPPDGPLRAISQILMDKGALRQPAWSVMRGQIVPHLDPTGLATLILAESSPVFEAFFARFARA